MAFLARIIREVAAAGKNLAEHLEAFRASLVAKNNTPDYVRLTLTRVQSLFEGCRFRAWNDINGAAVETWLAAERVACRLSAQASNFYAVVVTVVTQSRSRIHLLREARAVRLRTPTIFEEAILATAESEKNPQKHGVFEGFEELRLAGFGPATYGLGNRKADSTTTEPPSTCDTAENRVAFCVALLAPEWPDLAAVVKAWPDLPEAIRRAILAMVEAAGETAQK